MTEEWRIANGELRMMFHAALIGAQLIAGAAPVSQAKLPATLDLSTIRALPVQHDGRYPPLDTVARDIVSEITGRQFFQGKDPVLMLLAWTFASSTWQYEPLIPI